MFPLSLRRPTLRAVAQVLFVMLLALGQVFAFGSQPAQASGAGSRISWGGGSWYLQGANVPWYAWSCDFGCGSGGGGVSSSASRAALASRFAQAQANGVRVLRWWTFEGDPWQISRDANGAPTGLNPAVYADFDAALQLAEQYDLYYDFVLFSGASALPSGWLSDATQRAKLASALAPLFARYNGNPRVLSWEVFNEPDFDVWGNRVTEANLKATVKAVADAVHANSSAYVTVGMGFADGLSMVQGLGLDYYQAHWYDYMSSGGYCMRCNTYSYYQSTFNLDAPLVVGEMFAGSSTDALQRFEDFYAKGFAGAWAWSLFPEKTTDKLPVDLAAAQTFNSRHTDLGPRTSGGSTTPTATATPAATATTTPIPTATTPATPIPTATTATPAPTATFVAGASVASAPVAPGANASIVAAVTSSGASSALVDIEVYSASNVKMFQQYLDNQAFTAGQQRTFPVTWAVPANAPAGPYTVVVGVFSPGWGTLYTWNAQAGTVTVGTAGATATATTTAPAPSTATPRATATPPATATPRATATATPTRGPRRPVKVRHATFRSLASDAHAQSRTAVTVSAGTTTDNPSNSLRELRFSPAQNASIDIGTVQGQRGAFVYAVPAGTTELSFFVTRVADGSFLVPFTVVDDDGEWPTFVGEGS